MKLRRRRYFTNLAALVIAIFVFSPGQSFQTKQAPDCDLDGIKKQIKTAKEDEDHLLSLSEGARKELEHLDNALQGTMTEISDEIAPGVGASKFAAARKKYEETTAAYDQALSKYHEETSNGMEEEKAKSDVKLSAVETAREKARDEILNLVKEYTDIWKKMEGESEKKKKLEDLPGTPKTESKLERLERLRSEFEATEHQADESSDELAGWSAGFRAKQRKREALEKKLKDAEAMCAPIKPKPKPSSTSETRSNVDECLIGTWRSESGTLGPVTSFEGVTGGGGILLTIKSDGDTTINYTGMQEIKAVNTFTKEVLQTSSVSGTASGHIITKDGLVTVNSVEDSTLTAKLTTKYGTQTSSPSGLGAAFFGGGKAPSPYNLNYACSETTLIIRQIVQGESLGTFTFTREKKAP